MPPSTESRGTEVCRPRSGRSFPAWPRRHGARKRRGRRAHRAPLVLGPPASAGDRRRGITRKTRNGPEAVHEAAPAVGAPSPMAASAPPFRSAASTENPSAPSRPVPCARACPRQSGTSSPTTGPAHCTSAGQRSPLHFRSVLPAPSPRAARTRGSASAVRCGFAQMAEIPVFPPHGAPPGLDWRAASGLSPEPGRVPADVLPTPAPRWRP